MISIHLALKDKDYQAMLASRLAWCNRFKEVHSHESVSIEEIQANNQKELWILERANWQPEADKASNILWLTDSPTEKETECFAYQAFSQIQKKVIQRLYAGNLVEKVSENRESEFFYLYSPFGGVGVSSLSYQLAKEWSQTEKVLLLSLDSCHNFVNEFVSFCLSDLLFYWETAEQINVSDFCYHQNNLDILYGPTYPQDLQVLRQKSKQDFLRLISQSGYGKVVVDLSSSAMPEWFRPETANEKLVVLKKMEEKWKQFSNRIDFAYTAVPVGIRGADLCKQLGGGEYAGQILSTNH